jgi:hypothetical protein
MATDRRSALALPHLAPDEKVVGTATVWAARIGSTPRWLIGRHRHSLVVTDRRVLAFERRHRRATPALDEPFDVLALQRTRHVLWFTQVIVNAPDRQVLFEFRARDRATRIAFVESLRTRQPA